MSKAEFLSFYIKCSLYCSLFLLQIPSDSFRLKAILCLTLFSLLPSPPPYLSLICTSPVSALSSEWTHSFWMFFLPLIFLVHSTSPFSARSFALVSCKPSVSSSGIKVLLDVLVLILNLFVWLLCSQSSLVKFILWPLKINMATDLIL